MGDIVSEVIKLNKDIAALAERAGDSVQINIEKLKTAYSYINGVYKNTWIQFMNATNTSMDLGVRYSGGIIIAGKGLLAITALNYLSRHGFKQVLDYLTRPEPNGAVEYWIEFMKSKSIDPVGCLEIFEPIVEQVDSRGFIGFFAIDGERFDRYCHWFKARVEGGSLAPFVILGAIIHEMILMDTPPEAIQYPITPLSAEIVSNILSWRQQSSKLGLQLVEGNLGMGKTTYVFMSVLGALRLLMDAPPVGWETRLAPLIYLRSLDDLIDVLDYFNDPYNRDLYIPLMVIEDASSTLPKYWAWEGKETITKMKKVHELLINLRSRFANLIMVANAYNSLASFARELVHIRYSAINVDVGLVRHTLFAHNISRSRNPLLWGWSALRLMGAIIYPLNKLPPEVYRRDLELKNKAMRRTASELRGQMQGGGEA